VTQTLSLSMDRTSAELVLRCLTAEFDRLASAGRDTRTDPEIVVIGVYCETIDRWLMEQDGDM
jgi:hypothetical protein